MNLKSIRILTIILLILVATLVIRSITQQRQQNQPSFYNQTIKKIDLETINFIKLSQKEKSIAFIKKEDNWLIGDNKADRIKINQLLNLILTTDSVTLIARTNARHQELNLAENLATKVILKSGDITQLTLLVGKTESGGAYARFEDDDNVYLLPNLSSTYLSLEENDWFLRESETGGESQEK